MKKYGWNDQKMITLGNIKRKYLRDKVSEVKIVKIKVIGIYMKA
jgi:hypothetical protein